jgi:protein O-GlcNAc transferase
VTTTDAEFEELAVALAHDANRLQALRRRLEQSRTTAPLFDMHAYTLHLEAAYTAMMDRYDAGLAPEHISTAKLATTVK